MLQSLNFQSDSNSGAAQRLPNSGFIKSLKSPFNRTAHVDESGVITITPKQIYILPTRFGMIFAVMVIAMLIGSNNYGVNLGFMLTFLLAGIGLSAMIQTWRNLVHLQLTEGHAEPVFCGEMAVFSVYAHNQRPGNRSAVQLKISSIPVAFDLTGNQRLKVECQIPAAKRGIINPERWTVFSFFPLGMFYAWAYFDSTKKYLVYPKPVDADSTLDTLFHSQIRNGQENDDNIDFHGHRKYQPGDNLKRIDWKALARGRGYLVKNFLKNEDDDIWLEWSDVNADDVELKLSILCRAVLELSKFNTPFGLSLPGTQIEPDSGSKHRQTCLTALAVFNKKSTGQLPGQLQRNNLVRTGTVPGCITPLSERSLHRAVVLCLYRCMESYRAMASTCGKSMAYHNFCTYQFFHHSMALWPTHWP